jgi:hypothetical protein
MQLMLFVSIVQYISLLPYKLKEVVALKKLWKDEVNVYVLIKKLKRC